MGSTGGDDSPARGLPLVLLPRLRAALVEARQRYGELALPEGTFLPEVLRQGIAHWARQGRDATPAELETYVLRAALPDLVLACACEAGRPEAWRALHAHFAGRLEGFAVRRGLCSQDAEAIVQDLFGDLSLPPPRGGCRTLLGTFDATGSLFGWLSVVLVRRIAGQARKRKPGSLDAQDDDAREGAAPPGRAGGTPAALTTLLESESAERLRAGVARAWSGLSAQERFALVLKHRDERSQREIGTLLGLGEARVSRIVSAAVARLTEGVRAALDGGHGPEAGSVAWEQLVAAVASHLASQGPQAPPPSGRVGGSAGRAPGQAAPQDKGQA